MTDTEKKQVADMIGRAYREGYKNGARNFIGEGESDLKKAAGQSWDIHKSTFGVAE